MKQNDGTRQRGHPRKTWWNCVKDNMKRLSLAKRMHSLEINTQGKSGGIWLAHIYRVHALFVFQLFYVNVAHCLKQNGILVQEKISTDLFQVELIL